MRTFRGRIFIGALFASAGLLAQNPVFVQFTSVPVPGAPSSLALGDFDGDGTTDVAVVASGSGMVSILLGTGNGVFIAPRNVASAGAGARYIVAADFNRDGRLDLAVANPSAGTVSILLNNGGTTFRSVPSLSVAGANALAVADFNSDGNMDLAVTSGSSNSVSIFLGVGTGAFRPAPMTSLPTVSSPVSVVVGDLDGNGIPDLAVAGSGSSSITILLGIGGGAFRSFPSASSGGNPAYLVAGDVNGDGKLDLVTVDSGGGISAMIGRGGATYLPPLNSSTGGTPLFVALADFNGDGKLDAAVANSNGVSDLVGFGNGVFQSPLPVPSQAGPAWIGVSDFNNDGKPDLVIANSGANTVSVLLQSSSSQPPSITGNSIGNAASYQSGMVAPGELVTIFGSNLGPSQLVGLTLDSSGRVSTKLSDTQVFFDGNPAPLLYVSAGQVGAVVPYQVSGTTQVQVSSSSGQSNTVTLSVADTVPGIFTMGSTGSGQGAIINQDGTVNSDANPASAGDIVLIYGTGEGQTNPMGINGSVTGSNPPQLPASVVVSAMIGGKPASVKYDGAAPGFVAGVFQLNLKIPKDAGSGDLPVSVTIGSATSQAGVTVAVK